MSLFVITGIDGCGKTTQINLLADYLKGNNYPVVINKAYNSEAKVLLCSYINNWENNSMALMFLFQALHARQYDEAVKALNQGKIVLADRWDESYLAYHSNFGELSKDNYLLEKLNYLAFKDFLPELGFVITIPTSIARQRRESRGRIEKMENRSDDYYECIQEFYIQIARERNWCIIDGTKSKLAIHEEIEKKVNFKIRRSKFI